MRWLLLVGAISGCDFAFGLDDPELPKCLPTDFENARLIGPEREGTEIEVFSFTKDRELGVFSSRGLNVDARGDGDLEEIELKPHYSMMNAAMEPNGDYFFFTAAIEPFEIKAARPKDGDYEFVENAPKGFMAGTPSDRMFGDAVRVIVRLFPVPFDDVPDFVELEFDEMTNKWVEVHPRFTLKAIAGANLSPDGLVMVYDGYEDNDERGVYVRQRGSLAEPFRDFDNILPGVHLHPQLFDDCKTLYTLEEGGQLTSYLK